MMAQFSCTATGVPRPMIEWYYDNVSTQRRLVNGNDNVVIMEVSSGDREIVSTLTLSTTTHPDDTGEYTCRAVNVVDDYIGSATLNVLCRL